MMKAVSKSIIACSVAAFSLFASATASADNFNQFEVNPLGSYDNFKADKITGGYTEVITFNGGNFDVSLYWKAGQFWTDSGNTGLDADQTGLGNSYNLYATYKASGTFTNVGGVAQFFFTPGSGMLKVFLDPKTPTTTKIAPVTGAGDFNFGTSDDEDMLIASGNALSGAGSVLTNPSTCGPKVGINCGSFGSTTEFKLTGDGINFFVDPTPFYNLSFQSGQLNSFNPIDGTQTINGSLDVTFDRAEVPEPASLGLLGLGMLGLGFARRRKQS